MGESCAAGRAGSPGGDGGRQAGCTGRASCPLGHQPGPRAPATPRDLHTDEMARAGCCCETPQQALLVPFVCPHRRFGSYAGRRQQQLNSLRATLLPRAGLSHVQEAHPACPTLWGRFWPLFFFSKIPSLSCSLSSSPSWAESRGCSRPGQGAVPLGKLLTPHFSSCAALQLSF